MFNTTSSLLIVLALGVMTGCAKVAEDTRPGQPVKTRQVAFKEIIKVFEPMGTMLRTNKYEPHRFAALAAALVTKRDAPWAHFGQDTHYPPTKATAEVWRNADGFERERQAFMQATDELLAAADAKNAAEAEKAYFKVYDVCQSCHKRYKEK